MKETYEILEMEVITLVSVDIITDSNGGDNDEGEV